MASADMIPAPSIPAHVPPDLVRQFTLGQFAPTDRDPFDELIPEIHEGPDLFFAPQVGSFGDHGAWVFRRGADIKAAYQDDSHFSVSGATRAASLIDEDWDLIPNEIDPPSHEFFRTILNTMFSPRKMALLEDMVREEATRLIVRFADAGECDFMRDFAIPFPVVIFLKLLGLSTDEMDRYIRWEHMVIHSPLVAVKREGLGNIRDCLVAALAERRLHPVDDVLSGIITTEHDGKRMNEQEQLRTALTIFMAGLDTVTTTIGWQIKYLAETPDAQTKLRSNPALIVKAVEEMSRAFSPVTVNRRCVKRYVSPQGIVIEPGDQILLSTPVANRDPALYDQPNEVRLDRAETHITFGFGIHRCLGAHLARRELQVGVRQLLAMLPPFRRADTGLLPMHFGLVLGIDEMRLAWR